ncbi:hypothetical protein GS688_07830 [Rhodococcus hoagii]|nr:hypothetical protein [Prescottella equi]
MSQDLVRARRGIHNGPDTHAEQAETALAAAVHENNELRAENEWMRAAIDRTRAIVRWHLIGDDRASNELGMSLLRVLGGDR